MAAHEFTPNAQLWLRWLTDERGLSPLTVEGYGRGLETFRQWLQRPLETATRADIQGFLVAHLRQVSGRSVQQRLAALRSFYKFLRAEGIIGPNPTRGIKTPHSSKKLPDWLDEAQTRTLLDAALTADKPAHLALRDALALHLLYGSGLRAAELVSIVRSDIADDLSAVRVYGKGRIERVQPITSQTRPLLERYLNSPDAPTGEYLFPRYFALSRKYSRGLWVGAPRSQGRGHVSRQWLWKLVSETSKAAGISCHPHTLRHSAASHMTQNGAGVSIVQAFLGHSSPETTMIYSHLDLATLRRDYDQFHPRACSRKEEVHEHRRTA